jgi:hypothetical protein
MINRKEIKKKVPYGYGKVIAERAGVSTRYVSKFLNDSDVKSERVEIATSEVPAELNNKKKLLIAQI